MDLQPSFLIYNASAGSGKTFTLVKAYLSILLSSNQTHAFKNILALTFTNKAVAEMKERVVDMLIAFSNPDILENPTPMFGMLSKELNFDAVNLHQKSINILNTIAHNYAAFDISTIDKFNHRLIRTFAHDLKLPLNFEVELDTKTILAKAVDQLIDKAGTEKELTKILVDFAIEKADEDKSWDVAFDFNQIAQLLVNENDIPFFESLKDKSLEDFGTLKKQLKHDLNTLEVYISEKSQSALNLIADNGLEHSDFSRNSLPNHFLKLRDKIFDMKFENKWQLEIEDAKMYPTRVSSTTAATIDSIQPILASLFTEE